MNGMAGQGRRNCALIGFGAIVLMAGIELARRTLAPAIVRALTTTPDEVERSCHPITAWLAEQGSEIGAFPPELPSEFEAILDEFPYTWTYSAFRSGGPVPEQRCVLAIGRGEWWPESVYSVEWRSSASGHGKWFRYRSPRNYDGEVFPSIPDEGVGGEGSPR